MRAESGIDQEGSTARTEAPQDATVLHPDIQRMDWICDNYREIHVFRVPDDVTEDQVVPLRRMIDVARGAAEPGEDVTVCPGCGSVRARWMSVCESCAGSGGSDDAILRYQPTIVADIATLARMANALYDIAVQALGRNELSKRYHAVMDTSRVDPVLVVDPSWSTPTTETSPTTEPR